MSSPGNLGTAKEMYRCGHFNPYQNSHFDVFLSLFLTSCGGGKEFNTWHFSPLSTVTGSFTETARTSPQRSENCNQGPLTAWQQNIPKGLTAEHSQCILELKVSGPSHWSWLKREHHSSPSSPWWFGLSLTGSQTVDHSLLTIFPTISHVPFGF